MPSSTCSFSFGLSKLHASFGKNCLATRMTAASISQRTTSSTSGCFKTSRATPPSPAPMINTRFGDGCELIGRKLIISW